LRITDQAQKGHFNNGAERMYESFFGFVKRPFLAASTLDRYFPAACIEQTFQTAARAIQRGEGPVAIFGGTGLGKTMCCLRIADSFRRNFEVVMLSSSQLITRRALLQSLLFELRMPYRDMTEGELRLSLMSRLQPSTENPTDGLVLVVDEAQTMSMKLLDEIRLLTNVVRNGIPRVRLVLVGTMRLEDCLSHPHMDSLHQRLAARCYLTPLSSQETSQYVMHKIELSGVEGSSVMTRDALDAIYRGSDGIPRLIDQLADQSLMLACHDRERPVSAAMVGRAWCMLQQLPNPWSEPETIVKSSTSSGASMASGVQAQPVQVTSYSSPVISSQATSKDFSAAPHSPMVSAAGFDAMMKGSVASQASTPYASNIEFGELADDFIEESDTGATDQIGVSGSFETHSNMSSDFEEPVEVNKVPDLKKKNLLDVFAGDFDEEFSIPVQSSASYQAYSGAAYGNLNYDLSNFGTANRAPLDEQPLAFDEAGDFLSATAKPETRNVSHYEFASEQDELETISNISPEQAANLERQIEEEMRELVSDLNMSAMSFDPASSIDPYSMRPAPTIDREFDRSQDRQPAYRAHTDVISFSGMHSYANMAETNNEPERIAMGDDRDLLVVENDLESVRGGASQSNSIPHRAVLHPYAKLFSKLRNS